MKKRNIILYTVIMLTFSTFALEVVAQALTGKSMVPTLSISDILKGTRKQTVDNNFRCSSKPAIAGLDKASDPQLKKLTEYQQVCHSAVTSHMMVFNNMPKDDKVAKANAIKMASTLYEFSKFGITPIVITEPVTDWGDIDFKEFRSGFYDHWITTYFKTLKSQGLTDAQMGIWVPFPEANLPYWNRNNATPDDFAVMVNNYLTIAHQSFPSLQASIMLNSATYSANDFDWSRGDYLSLVPYVKDIKKGLVSSFGFQGFPWMPPANQSGPGIFDASSFLNPKLAKEAADSMGVKNIWFNTGTFASKYVSTPNKQTGLTPERRTDILNGVLSQAKELKTQGYNVSINLFSKDKSNTDEANDWSYFNSSSVLTSPASPVFANFASRLNQNGIDLWIFDSQN